MTREIVLDTETTGLDARSGHRLIEVACVELMGYLPTGRTFHRLVHPDREIDPEAERVHGISLASLEGKPRFDAPEVCDDLLAFIGQAPVIAHNAAFDRSFINMELERAARPPLPEDRWIDSMDIARKRFPGMYNSLDALCKRFKISLAEREKHSAMVDTKLLAAVYLELRGGREQGLDLDAGPKRDAPDPAVAARADYGPRPRPLAARASPEELDAHRRFILEDIKSDALWAPFGL